MVYGYADISRSTFDPGIDARSDLTRKRTPPNKVWPGGHGVRSGSARPAHLPPCGIGSSHRRPNSSPVASKVSRKLIPGINPPVRQADLLTSIFRHCGYDPRMSVSEPLARAIKEAKATGCGLFSYDFETALGAIDCLAEVRVAGDSIELNSLCVYPGSATPPTAKGALFGEMLRQIRSLLRAARKLGYSEVNIDGKRVSTSSSARPGKSVLIRRRIK